MQWQRTHCLGIRMQQEQEQEQRDNDNNRAVTTKLLTLNQHSQKGYSVKKISTKNRRNRSTMPPISFSTANSITSLRCFSTVGKQHAFKGINCNRNQWKASTPSLTRAFSDNQHESSSVHFRATTTPHPLATKANNLKASKPIPTISGLDKDGNPLIEVTAKHRILMLSIEYLI